MHATLADHLLAAVRAQDFAATADGWRGGAPVAHFPSIDLAVAVFPAGRPPLWANVLFSREHPAGVVADISAEAGPVRNIRFDADQRDAAGNSIAWLPGADWQRLQWQPLAGSGHAPPSQLHARRFVAPYPASLLKLMLAVGVALAVDRGLCAWPAALEPMIVRSDNDATNACVALLHQVRMVDALNATFAGLGLLTLQVNGTHAGGGWRNADGAGVGMIHMTAWDTVRLLWLLDADAPPAPWLQQQHPHHQQQAGTPALLQPATRAHLRGVLQRQQLDHVLSSGSLRALAGWVPGLPDAPAFAHKTGSTDNYASDAGIVRAAGGVHYLVALLTSLGGRYAPHPACVTTWRLPALGAAIHRVVEALA